MLFTISLALTLVAASLGLLLWHWSAFRAADHGGLGEREERFHARQFRLRTHASGTLGLIGVLILAGVYLENDWLKLAHAFLLLLMGGWMVLLALQDYFLSRSFWQRDEAASLAQIAILKKQLREHLDEAERGSDS